MSGSVNPLKINDPQTLLKRVNRVLRKRTKKDEEGQPDVQVNGYNWISAITYVTDILQDMPLAHYLTEASDRYKELVPNPEA